MADYSVTFARSARKELEALSDLLIQKIFPKIEALTIEPRPSGCRKLQGFENLWRVRIGNYRVIYSIDDNTRVIDIVAVRHRQKAYQ